MIFRKRRHPARTLVTSLLAAGCFVAAAVYFYDLPLGAVASVVLWTTVGLLLIVPLSIVALVVIKLVAGAIRRLNESEESQ